MTVSLNNLTDLRLSTIGIPPYSARGLVSTFIPIQQSMVLKRTINGRLINLSPTQFQLYHITLTCNDMQAPAFDGVMPGRQLTVDSAQELGYAEYSQQPSRDMVPGSERFANGFIFYRPRFVCLVTAFSQSSPEYEARYNWTLELEEEGGD